MKSKLLSSGTNKRDNHEFGKGLYVLGLYLNNLPIDSVLLKGYTSNFRLVEEEKEGRWVEALAREI